jgi:hypothetical protein
MVDLDAIGGAATGGLVASQFEKPTGQAGEHATQCADCGTETIGRFCHVCGNPSHVHRTLLHLAEELLHGVMHFDSRTWRTLPLLAFRPGRLTREGVMGKRTRYVSPLALFLFTIFVMFMALSYMPAKPGKTLAEVRIETASQVAQGVTKVAKAERAYAAATPETKADAEDDLKDARRSLAEDRKNLAGIERTIKTSGADGDWKEMVQKNNWNFNTGSGKLNEKLKEKFANPELAIYKLQQAFYKFSFLLVPISIPFVALLFLWRRGFTLYDHGVFVLYSLTFMSLLVMVVAGASRVGGLAAVIAWVAAPFIVPAHMYYQLQGAYGLKTFSTLWRTFFLLFFSFTALMLFVGAILWMESAV